MYFQSRTPSFLLVKNSGTKEAAEILEESLSIFLRETDDKKTDMAANHRK